MVKYLNNLAAVAPVQNDAGKLVCSLENVPADIIFLLDGSSSVESGFQMIKSFVSNVADGFTISPTATQVGIVQFSENPRTEFSLNSNPDIASLQQAINKINFLEGTGYSL